jgi:hypothetical protein
MANPPKIVNGTGHSDNDNHQYASEEALKIQKVMPMEQIPQNGGNDRTDGKITKSQPRSIARRTCVSQLNSTHELPKGHKCSMMSNNQKLNDAGEKSNLKQETTKDVVFHSTDKLIHR